MGIRRNATKAHDIPPQRREDPKHRVVLARLFSNSSSSPLSRAIRAYRGLRLSKTPPERSRWVPNRAKWLNDTEMGRLVERYKAGASVYELAVEFGVHRTIISQRLKGAGVTMRRQPLTTDQVETAAKLYATGMSLADVGRRLGVHASTVHQALRQTGVVMRKPWERPRQRLSKRTPASSNHQ